MPLTNRPDIAKALSRALFHTNPDACVVSRLEDGVIVDVNESFSRVTGHRREEVLGRSALELDIWDGGQQRDAFVRRVQERGEIHNLQLRLRHREGWHGEALVSARVIAIGEVPHLLTVARDVSELRRAQEARVESDGRLRTVLDATSDGFWDRNLRTGEAYYSPAWAQMLGYAPGEVGGTVAAWTERIHPDDRRAVEEALGAHLAGEVRQYRAEFRMRNKAGGWQWVLSRGRVVEWDDRGEPLRIVGTHTDITEHRQALQALWESERQYRSIFESMIDGFALYDAGHRTASGVLRLRFLEVNPAYEQLTGLRREDVLGRYLDEVLPDADPVWLEQYTAVAESGQPARFSRHSRVFGKHFEVYAFVPAPAQLATIFVDITARKRLEEQLRHSEKMEAIGQLAGGIAHDFNNQLGGILGFADLLVRFAEDPDKVRRYAGQIIASSRRAADLTAQLLAFARKGKFREVTVDVHSIITEVVELLRHTVDRRIALDMGLQAEESVVLGDPTQLQNALLNLGINARDAMPDGGALRFLTRTVALDAAACRASPFAPVPGRYLEIEVVDDGCGMPEDVRRRAFEPFFTTKERGKGTGMGLAGVYGAVKNHGGEVALSSQPGQGTRVTLHLPLWESGAAPAAPPLEAAPAAVRGRILIVDDEEVIRTMAADILEGYGYAVEVCVGGREAVARLRSGAPPVDVVLLDMIMPHMDGSQTYRALRAVNPTVPVILCSGYSLDGQAQALLEQGVAAFLQKPFRAAQLGQAVAKAFQA